MNKKFFILIPFISLLIAGGIFWWWQGQKELRGLGIEAQVKVKAEEQQTTVKLPDGAKIILPAGSAPMGTIVTVRSLDPATSPELPEWATRAILLYEFEVSQSLQSPVILQLPMPESQEVSTLGHYHDGKWALIPFEPKNGIAILEVEELSFFGWLDSKVSWFVDKITDFLTLQWVEEITSEPFCQRPYEKVSVDESNAFGFVSGCAQKGAGDGDQIQLIIRNKAPLHLEVYPIGEHLGKINVQLIKPGVYLYKVPSVDGTILAPRDIGEWSVQLAPGDDISFEAYFSDSAFAALIGDIIPSGRFGRALIERILFSREGRAIGWADLKNLLIVPAFAEFSKTVEEMDDKYIFERAQIRFILSEELGEETPSQTVEETPEGEEGEKETLQPLFPLKVSGFIVDQHGEPVKAADFWLVNAKGDKYGRGETTPTGYLEIDTKFIPEGEYVLHIEKSNWSALTEIPYCDPYERKISITSEGVSLETITIHKWSKITAKIVDESGAPVGGGPCSSFEVIDKERHSSYYYPTYPSHWGYFNEYGRLETHPLPDGEYILRIKIQWGCPFGEYTIVERKINISGNDIALGEIAIPKEPD